MTTGRSSSTLCHPDAVARLRPVALLAAVLGACAVPAPGPPPGPAPSTTASAPATAPAIPPPPAAPSWQVGATPLPLRPDGFGQVLPTPDVLADRALPTVDVLPPPAPGGYQSSVVPVPPDVLARSTWQPGCPVAAGELRYLTMSFLGFDGLPHTGEMIVHADMAAEVVGVFGELFAARFPIEEMRVVAAAELDLAPTGDGNNTTSFVCRAARGQSRWSAHAYALAIDVNPFCNPYVSGDLVLPELASAYLDRGRARPGMVAEGGPVVAAFDSIGWAWGGRWSQPLDIMHFSATGD